MESRHGFAFGIKWVGFLFHPQQQKFIQINILGRPTYAKYTSSSLITAQDRIKTQTCSLREKRLRLKSIWRKLWSLILFMSRLLQLKGGEPSSTWLVLEDWRERAKERLHHGKFYSIILLSEALFLKNPQIGLKGKIKCQNQFAYRGWEFLPSTWHGSQYWWIKLRSSVSVPWGWGGGRTAPSLAWWIKVSVSGNIC